MPKKTKASEEDEELKKLAHEKDLKHYADIKGNALGYVLVVTGIAKEMGVYNKLLKFDEVVELQPLIGEYDLIVKIQSENYETLGKFVIHSIRAMPEVIDTKTLTTIRY